MSVARGVRRKRKLRRGRLGKAAPCFLMTGADIGRFLNVYGAEGRIPDTLERCRGILELPAERAMELRPEQEQLPVGRDFQHAGY